MLDTGLGYFWRRGEWARHQRRKSQASHQVRGDGETGIAVPDPIAEILTRQLMSVMTPLVGPFLLLFLTAGLPESVAAVSPREVFSQHDPEGRLSNTSIRSVGDVKAKGTRFNVYYLTFVNPVSRHGQHRIAVIREDNVFVGSFQCWLEEGGARLTFGPGMLIVHEGGAAFTIRFNRIGPIERAVALCGEGSGWENGI